MLKIVVNHNKKDIIYSYTIGQTFPVVQGKLLRIEANGNELAKIMELNEIPINITSVHDTVSWHNKHAGRILKLLREMYA